MIVEDRFIEFQRLVRRALQSAVAWGFAFTVLRGLGFLVVTAYALKHLPVTEMGIWFVMLNIAGLAAIVEFGFAATIGRFASYYAAGAPSVPRLGLDIPPGSGEPNRAALAGLIRMSRTLYRGFAAAVAAIMLLSWFLWQSLSGSGQHVSAAHNVTFVLLVAGSAFSMAELYWMTLLYGTNQVRQVNQLQLLGLAVNYGLALAGLLAGFGLTALVVGQIAWSAIPRTMARRMVLREFSPRDLAHPAAISWRDLWATTWRSGAITLSSYVCIQGTTLVCAWVTDLQTTACYGLSIQLALMLHQVAASWLAVKFPLIGALRTRGDLPGARRIVSQRLLLSMLTYTAGGVVILMAGPWLLTVVGAKTSLLPVPLLAALLGWIGVELALGNHSAVLLTGNVTPHMPGYLVTAACVAPLAVYLGLKWGVAGLIAATLLAQLPWNYWWTPWKCWTRLLARSERGS